jgi:hypothetical protein
MPQMDMTTFYDLIFGVLLSFLIVDFKDEKNFSEYELIYLIAYDRFICLEDNLKNKQ